MSKNDNVVHLHGKVKRHPYYGQGAKASYCFLTVETGDGQFKQYHNVTLFKELADWAKDLSEGHEVWITGELQYKSYKLPDPENSNKTLYISDAKIIAHHADISAPGAEVEEVDDRP